MNIGSSEAETDNSLRARKCQPQIVPNSARDEQETLIVKSQEERREGSAWVRRAPKLQRERSKSSCGRLADAEQALGLGG